MNMGMMYDVCIMQMHLQSSFNKNDMHEIYVSIYLTIMCLMCICAVCVCIIFYCLSTFDTFNCVCELSAALPSVCCVHATTMASCDIGNRIATLCKELK